jgi:hypothetical protein
MSIRALDWAFKQNVQPLHKFVLVALADYANDRGLAYPSIQTLTRKTNLSRSSILRALSSLCEKQVLTDTGSSVGRTLSIKVYRIGVPPELEAVSVRHPEPEEEPLKESKKKNQLSTFIEFLIKDSRFDGLDVEGEVERAVEWCRKKNKAVTERFLENWLLHAEPPLEEDEEEVGSLAAEDYYSWAGWTEERRRALLELWPGVVEPPPRWDKLSADLKEQIDARVKEGWG